MPAIGMSNLPDVEAVQLVAKFQTSSGGTSGATMRYCSRVSNMSGENTGNCLVAFPLNTFPSDPQAQEMALKNNAIGSQILLNTRCQIDYAEAAGVATKLMCGTLVKWSHNLKEDSIVGEVFDDRWLLSKITVFGRGVYDPSSNVYFFDATQPCTFNKMGYPDCVDHPVYGAVFAPSFRYGWQSGGANETTADPMPGYATSKARKWRVEDCIQYLCTMHSAQAKRPGSPVDYGNQTLPACVNWPASLGTFKGSDRTLNDENIENRSLLTALEQILRRGGAYDLDVEPAGNFNTNLCVRNMNPDRSAGVGTYIRLDDGSVIGALMGGADVIQSGSVTESIINRFEDTCIVGDPVSCERMICTDGTSPFDIGLQPACERAWQRGIGSIDQDAKAYVAAHPDINQDPATPISMVSPLTIEATDQMFLQFPDWLCAFRTNRGVDLFSNTKWAGTPLGARYARFHPSQLTSFSTGGSANPANWCTKEIVVEAKHTKAEMDFDSNEVDTWNHADPPPSYQKVKQNEWFRVTRFDNLTLNPDSTILFLEGLRQNKNLWYNGQIYDHDSNSIKQTDPPTYFTPREMRIQVAVQSTWALTGVDRNDYNKTKARINPQGPKWTWLTVAKPGDYVEFLRTDASRPNGELIEEPYKTDYFKEKATAGNELYSDRPGDPFNPTLSGRMPSHAAARQADVNRIDYGGSIIIARLSPAMKPGLPIQIVGRNIIPVFAVVKCVVFVSDKSGQYTIVEFGPPDSKEIYDSPGAYQTVSPITQTEYERHSTTPTATSTTSGYVPSKKEDITSGYVPSNHSPQETTTSGGNGNTRDSGYIDNPTGFGGKDTDNLEQRATQQEFRRMLENGGDKSNKSTAKGPDVYNPKANGRTENGDEGASGGAGGAGKSSRQYSGAPKNDASVGAVDGNRIDASGTSRNDRQEAIRERSESWPGNGSGKPTNSDVNDVTGRPGDRTQESIASGTFSAGSKSDADINSSIGGKYFKSDQGQFSRPVNPSTKTNAAIEGQHKEWQKGRDDAAKAQKKILDDGHNEWAKRMGRK